MYRNRKQNHFVIITTLPDVFPGPLNCGIVGKSLKNGIWCLEVINLYDYGIGIHKKIDDTPYGGGAGMVIMAEVLANAINDMKNKYKDQNIDFYYMSPRGEMLNQKIVKKISKYLEDNIVCVICGRFEGIDQRIIDFFNIKELSIGQYILSNGDIAAIVVIDSVVRLLNGVLGNNESGIHESFSNFESEALIEHDQYTKPMIWNGLKVPDVLLSGHHQRVNEWKIENSIKNTKKLLKK
jgi:tRNA (guanine37-N1)-methyltransferase